MTPAARRALVTFGVLAGTAAVGLAIAPLREEGRLAVGFLLRGDLEALREYLLSFGALAPLVSALLMVGQSVVAPLPAFVITLANGLLFGALWGGLLSWSSAMVGAALCFWLARAFGRPVAERLVGRGPLEAADRFFIGYGPQAVVLARLLPFVPFDPVSYAAGLTRMRLVPFLVATGVGQLPATAVYSYAGERAGGALGGVLGLLAAAVAFALVGRVVFARRRDATARKGAGASPGRPPRNGAREVFTYRAATAIAVFCIGILTLALAPRPGARLPADTGGPAAEHSRYGRADTITGLLLLAGMEAPDERTPAPAFSLPRLEGGTLRLADLEGRVVFLNFWATWCPPCKAEMPAMEQLHRELGGEGLAVVAVNLQETPAQVGAFVEEMGLSFPILLDEAGTVASGTYLINALPTTYILDRKGRIVARAVGPRDWTGGAARALFEVLLSEPGGPGARSAASGWGLPVAARGGSLLSRGSSR